MKKAFDKFGFDLIDPDTGVSLNIPKSFSATYDYSTKPCTIFVNPIEAVDKVLKTSWSGKLTKGLP
jgi:hypothetical protein